MPIPTSRAKRAPLSPTMLNMKPLPPIDDTPDNVTVKTESIGSDAPAPASSGIFSGTQTQPFKFDLDTSFPAIRAPLELLRRIPHSQDINALRSLAPIFTQCLVAILDSMSQLPDVVRSSSAFQMAESGVTFSKDLFLGHVKKISADGSANTGEKVEQIANSLQLLEMTMSSLKELLQVAETELMKTKPLPETPTLDEYADELMDNFVEVQTSPSTEGEGDQAPKPPPILKTRKSKLSGFFKPISIRAKKKKAKAAATSSPADSSSTLVATDTELETQEYKRASSNIRNSIAKFPDIFAPQVEEAMPHPADSPELYFDAEGILRGGTLRGLVFFLTSRDPTRDFEFLDMFFLSFRCFASSKALFQALVARYQQDLPEDLPAAQRQTEAYHIKMRVAKILHLWVDLHWRQAFDGEIFALLLHFCFNDLAKDLPQELSSQLATALHACARGGADYRSRRLQQRAKAALPHEKDAPLTWAPPTEHLMSCDDFSRTSVLSFNTPEGHQFFAMQLSLCMWDKYSRVDPEDAVKFWHDGQDKKVGTLLSAVIAFEDIIALWVTKSIVESPSPETRVELIGAFLDISKECINDRNYAGAVALYLGVMRVANSLNWTFPLLSAERTAFMDYMTHFFNVRDLTPYRNALEMTRRPAIPMTTLFVKEVVCISSSSPPTIEHPHEPGLKLINFTCYRSMTKIVRRMEKCYLPYQHTPVDYMQKWFEHVFTPLQQNREVEEAKILEQSAKIEPKSMPRPSPPPRLRSWQRKLESVATTLLSGMEPELLQISTCC
ncbi:ras guanine nucleotide exchange factor domain-containing protein [Hygrophoropsis aurantiaca]|uniref:Ras guanine nucleotide exchange factor domain-containing protein n=1 Tax=Hygrophoropsis aurantiaca TaxID=72124 RepID=A0ACB8ACJ8_9AGAM|nr:ras guanine nucleotide exchange factor domain-containing protein [Hygrophoropsis aurantiaca]